MAGLGGPRRTVALARRRGRDPVIVLPPCTELKVDSTVILQKDNAHGADSVYGGVNIA